MKILLMGDASNYHRALAFGLSALGHDVTVASDGTRWLGTERDIDLSRSLPGPAGGALLYLRLCTVLASDLRGYDVVHLCSPGFVQLKPQRIRNIFDRLKRDNGAVILTALGTDTYYVSRVTSDNPPLRYSEWAIGTRPTPFAIAAEQERREWLTDKLKGFSRYIYENTDGCVTALYEYHRIMEDVYPADRLAYIGIPIDTAGVNPVELPPVGPVRIMVAYHPGRMVEKGIDILLPGLRRLEASSGGRIVVDEVSGIPYADFVRRLRECHIIADQAYSYTPATTALLTMATGRVTVSGAEPEYYDFIGEHGLRPIINVEPDDIDSTMDHIREIALDTDRLMDMSRQGPLFVRRHNDSLVVARRLEDFYRRLGLM